MWVYAWLHVDLWTLVQARCSTLSMDLNVYTVEELVYMRRVDHTSI